jgi:hypothetical protein
LPEGSTCPSGEVEICQGGSVAPVHTLPGSGEAKIVPNRAQGSGALMMSWGSGEAEGIPKPWMI